MTKWLIVAGGLVCVLLGGLWLLEGLGIVVIQPILCVAECDPVEGVTPAWAVFGALTLAAGSFAVWMGLRRRR